MAFNFPVPYMSSVAWIFTEGFENIVLIIISVRLRCSSISRMFHLPSSLKASWNAVKFFTNSNSALVLLSNRCITKFLSYYLYVLLFFLVVSVMRSRKYSLAANRKGLGSPMTKTRLFVKAVGFVIIYRNKLLFDRYTQLDFGLSITFAAFIPWNCFHV